MLNLFKLQEQFERIVVRPASLGRLSTQAAGLTAAVSGVAGFVGGLAGQFTSLALGDSRG